jgi:hypothetical protein
MDTPRVFWAVTAVMATEPWTPSAEKVLMSASMPAPPPESDPAMVKALGMLLGINATMIEWTGVVYELYDHRCVDLTITFIKNISVL